MELHPTIVAASGNEATQIVAELKGQWRDTLGDANEVLAFALPPKCEQWARAIREVHDVPKVARLQRRGHYIDYATNAVWLAEVHDRELPQFLSSLHDGVQRGLIEGRELRLHLLLLLPDLFCLSQAEQDHARENLALLHPGEDAVLPIRVWPLSIRNRVDLYLRDALDLLPLVQHFVEACLFRSFPLHPSGVQTRDWGGVGCCRFVVGRPSAQNLAAELWREIKTTYLLEPSVPSRAMQDSPSGGEPGEASSGGTTSWDWPSFLEWFRKLRTQPPRTIPDVPLCPAAPTVESLAERMPQEPQRQSCSDHPKWETVSRPWVSCGEKTKERCKEEIASKTQPLEPLIEGELVQSVLHLGLPAVRELRRRLEKLVARANADFDAALEPFDRLMGVSQARRKHWLSAGVRTGAPPGEERVGPELEERLNEVDHALEECELERFLANDPDVQEIDQELIDIRGQFELNQKQWKERFDKKEQPSEPELGQRPALWRRIGDWLTRAARWVFGELIPPKPPQESEEDLMWRKRYCDKAWLLIHRAYELERKKWELTLLWLQRWAEFRVRGFYRDALVRAVDRCNQFLSQADQLELNQTDVFSGSMVLSLDLPQKMVQETVTRLAKKLVGARILEELWEGRPDSFRDRLIREAERAIADFPEPTLEELLDDNAWAAGFDIAAPRVMVAHRPQQQTYTLVFCSGPPPRVPERLLCDRHWRSGEAVMFRFVYPIFPEELLSDLDVPPLMRRGRDEEAEAEYAMGFVNAAGDDRPNRMLEEVFGADAA